MRSKPSVGDAPTTLELDILRAYEQHGSIAEAGQSLGLSAAYARKLLVYLYAKLGVKSAVQASRVLRERDLL